MSPHKSMYIGFQGSYNLHLKGQPAQAAVAQTLTIMMSSTIDYQSPTSKTPELQI